MSARGAWIAAWVWLAASIASAQPEAEAPSGSSIDALAASVDAQIQGALDAHPGGSLAIWASAELPSRASALTDALVEPVLATLRREGRWRACGRTEIAGTDEAAARDAAHRGHDVLISLGIRSQGNFLVVSGGVWSTERSSGGAPIRLGSVSTRVRLDAELRQFAGPLPPISDQTLVARSAPLPGRGYVAMSSVDLDGDGSTELLLVTARGMDVVRLAPSRVGLRIARVTQASFPPDAPTATVRRRRIVGSATQIANGIFVRVSERAPAFRVQLEGSALAIRAEPGPCPLDLYPLEGGCGRLSQGRDFFEPTVLIGGTEHEAPGSFYSRATRRVRTSDGGAIEYEAIVTPHGRLAVRIDERSIGAVGYGTALALADLDDDGSAELLVSSAQAAGTGDQLTILRALPRGALHVVWRSEPIEGSVLIAASGDLDSDGLDEMLAIEEPADEVHAARLWVVR